MIIASRSASMKPPMPSSTNRDCQEIL